MPTLKELLDQTTAMHRHLCPRQVLGVRMGLYAGELLGLALPQSDKRLYTIMETDGCAADGVAVAVDCWVGRRTMRIEDFGKVAATFVDTQTGVTLRIVPRPTVRLAARGTRPKPAANGKRNWSATNSCRARSCSMYDKSCCAPPSNRSSACPAARHSARSAAKRS